MKVLRNPRSNGFCGPAALSIITGFHVDDLTADLRHNRGRRTSIRGVANWEMVKVLEASGIKVTWLPFSFVAPDGFVHSYWKPTLAQWLRKYSGRAKDAFYLLNLTHHYVVVRGRKLYDNFHPEGVFLRAYPHRRKRVVKAWECTR